MSKVLHLNENNFKAEVLEANGVVLVDFWAAWCGPCKMLGPIIEQLSEEMPNVKFAKVNVDEVESLAARYGIRSIPTMYIFKNGEIVDKLIGLLPKEALKNKLAQYL
ncbi:thioredoxin [Hypnocyclicus thermotrophus]|uniref:Thioredoxin n=1 Tax=Hypnocyclicus thermotrophus TaxID=1627895 RepID=A0AA46DZW9_9FUSO|nr:thioredoxin [Hypnocyclicus thermotrophus]TDT71746.1 thioredoxin [Hypnocyclicus thermotrophus]